MLSDSTLDMRSDWQAPRAASARTMTACCRRSNTCENERRVGAEEQVPAGMRCLRRGVAKAGRKWRADHCGCVLRNCPAMHACSSEEDAHWATGNASNLSADVKENVLPPKGFMQRNQGTALQCSHSSLTAKSRKDPHGCSSEAKWSSPEHKMSPLLRPRQARGALPEPTMVRRPGQPSAQEGDDPQRLAR